MSANRSIVLGTTITGTGAEEAKGASPSRGIIFRLTGTFVGTVALQGSMDGTNWDTVASATDETPQYVQDRPYTEWRANCTAYTSGTIDEARMGFAD